MCVSIIQRKCLDRTGDINLEVGVRVEMVLKAMSLDEITKKNEDGQKKRRGI